MKDLVEKIKAERIRVVKAYLDGDDKWVVSFTPFGRAKPVFYYWTGLRGSSPTLSWSKRIEDAKRFDYRDMAKKKVRDALVDADRWLKWAAE